MPGRLKVSPVVYLGVLEQAQYIINYYEGIIMNRNINIFFVIFISIILLTCSNNRNYYKHSWLKYPNEFVNDNIESEEFLKKEYDGKYVSIWQYNINAEIIKEEYKNKYITLLYENDCIEITQDEANNISYNKFTDENKRYYIIRALYPLLGGIYIIKSTSDNNVFVYYTVMARKDYKLKEDALIIEVDNPPQNIYISFSITS
jgi:hypothetical protein